MASANLDGHIKDPINKTKYKFQPPKKFYPQTLCLTFRCIHCVSSILQALLALSISPNSPSHLSCPMSSFLDGKGSQYENGLEEEYTCKIDTHKNGIDISNRSVVKQQAGFAADAPEVRGALGRRRAGHVSDRRGCSARCRACRETGRRPSGTPRHCLRGETDQKCRCTLSCA